MKRLGAEFRKPLFWVILAVFLAGVYLHYSQYLPLSVSGLSSFLGLEHHSIERILFLVVIILGAVVSGMTVGLGYLVLSVVAMLPQLFLSPNSGADNIFEVVLVIVTGLGFNLWLEEHRREVGRREQALLKLEAVQREVQEHIKTVRQNEKRLAVLHSVTAAINQFSNLDSILSTAVDKVKEAVDVDSVLIYLTNARNELKLRQYSGISEEFSHKVDHLKVGEGFNGGVALTGKPAMIENSSNDPRLSREVVKKELIGSQFIVPLTAQEKVVGTLCALSRSVKYFTRDEEQLLILIGSELGVAVERSALTEEKDRVGRRFKELFEKAHDAIWVQDLNGKILDANQAMAEFTGYNLKSIIGGEVANGLTPEALELAREVRRKLLSGIPVEQPYEQKVIRDDGTEATIMLTTSLIKEEGKPAYFQHISRDVTREKKLTENLRLYAQQITQAQEEERKRIARELHDESIQTLVILSRHIDELISAQSKRSKMIRPLEEVRGEVDNIIAQVRRFTQDLRPPTLDYLGLIPAVRELTSQLEHQSSIKTELKTNGVEKHFTPEDEMLIYRIIQESLSNVWKHSGAMTAMVSINFGKEDTTIEIRDDGKGFVIGEDMRFVQSGKIGLAGMLERADLLGANLSVQSNVGRGTLVTLLVPDERWKK
ncbi:MAG: PAS domain S-box protein [Dehalococcoidales bacterium]|nr:PAS domain S-box protein [Dehalococcoidales bacterium]